MNSLIWRSLKIFQFLYVIYVQLQFCSIASVKRRLFEELPC